MVGKKGESNKKGMKVGGSERKGRRERVKGREGRWEGRREKVEGEKGVGWEEGRE